MKIDVSTCHSDGCIDLRMGGSFEMRRPGSFGMRNGGNFHANMHFQEIDEQARTNAVLPTRATLPYW